MRRLAGEGYSQRKLANMFGVGKGTIVRALRPTTYRDDHLRRNYGITQADEDRMWAEQRGLCKICGRKLRGRLIDHCHSTGRVRGVLCNPCNISLGWFERHREAIESYLA